MIGFVAVAITVAIVEAVRPAFAVAGTAQAFNLQVHQALRTWETRGGAVVD